MSTGAAGHLDEGTVAAYLLGGLGRAETAARERHLRDCDACQQQVAGLAEVRRMLGLVPASLVLEDPALAGGAGGRVHAISGGAAAARRDRAAAARQDWAAVARRDGAAVARRDGAAVARRDGAGGRRGRWWSAAAIVVAAVVAAVLVPVLVSRIGAPGGRQPPATVVMVTGFDVSTHVSALMRLRPGPTASTFDLRLVGAPAGAMLSVVADRVDGGPVLAGRWMVPPYTAGTVFKLFGSVDVKVADLAGFRVLLPGGNVLVDLVMPKTPASASPSP